MIYEFETEQGDRIEASFPMSEAPAIGQIVQIEGHGPCRRVVSSGLVMNPAGTVECFDAYSLDPELARRYGHRRFNEDGSPRFRGKAEAEALAQRSEGEIHFGALPAKAERDRFRRPAKEVARQRAKG